MNRHKPKMRYSRANEAVNWRGWLLPPVKKLLHLMGHVCAWRSFIMDFFFAHASRNNPHWFLRFSPRSHFNFIDAGKARGKQSSLPAMQSLGGERLLMISN